MTPQKSQCCNAEIATSVSDEGTGCFVCSKCGGEGIAQSPILGEQKEVKKDKPIFCHDPLCLARNEVDPPGDHYHSPAYFDIPKTYAEGVEEGRRVTLNCIENTIIQMKLAENTARNRSINGELNRLMGMIKIRKRKYNINSSKHE